jgi:hypothetical protein
MAIILSFVPRKRLSSSPGAFGPASIIIFPGVRYERGGGRSRLPPEQRRSRPKQPKNPPSVHSRAGFQPD